MNGEHKTGGGVAPAFLNGKQTAALLGVSERKLAEMRAQGLLPAPIILGPRSLRFDRDALLAHLRSTAPRGGLAEPAHLATPAVREKRIRARAAALAARTQAGA